MTREIKVNCVICNREHIVVVSEEGYNKWKGGEPIQHAMPDIPPCARELLISGIGPMCWDFLFRINK